MGIFFFACFAVLILHFICEIFAPKNPDNNQQFHEHRGRGNGSGCCSGYKEI